MNKLHSNSNRVYIIAELSANHEQDIELAKKSIRAIKATGADAVKVQTFTADSMTLNSDKDWFQARKDSLWAGRQLYELYQEAALPYEWHEVLKKVATDEGLDFFSTPFDPEGVDFLESLHVPIYKVASLEITDIPLIKKIAQTGKPMIISTGIATEEDIQLAVQTCVDAGNNKYSLLKCTSAYPTPFDEVNLRSMQFLNKFKPEYIGISDHTLGIDVPVLSVALGAKIIEKHFILDKHNSSSVDKDFSLDKDEFSQMVEAVRKAETILGESAWQLTDKQVKARVSSRSLFAAQDIRTGEKLTTDNVRSLRPGLGIHPMHFDDVIGKKAKQNIEKGTPLNFDLIE